MDGTRTEMNVIIWSLVLTVCAPSGQCFNQTVQWFDKENECLRYKQISKIFQKIIRGRLSNTSVESWELWKYEVQHLTFF
ncbi:MAG: hypothetical protein CM15mV47_650 [uncultured marine virus]|nr:MAG: hypothetical protein CM15mV47_650 [uncultured marine virus]